jgi:hypothetical protein
VILVGGSSPGGRRFKSCPATPKRPADAGLFSSLEDT